MDLEDYLITELDLIIAVNLICKALRQKVTDNYYEILKGEISSSLLLEIISLIFAIQGMTYCMRIFNKESYLKIEPDYKDDFTYNSMMFEL